MLQLAELTGLPKNVIGVLLGVLAVLAAGSAGRILWLRHAGLPGEERRSRLGSLVTWWILYALMATIAILGVSAAAIVFAVLGFLGLGEYRNLAQRRIVGTAPWWWVFAAVPIHYLLVWGGWLGPFWTFIPVWVLFALLVRLAVVPSRYSISICNKARGEWPYRSSSGSQYQPLPNMIPNALGPFFS